MKDIIILEKAYSEVLPFGDEAGKLLDNIFSFYGKDIFSDFLVYTLFWNEDDKPGKVAFYRNQNYYAFTEMIQDIKPLSVIAFTPLLEKLIEGDKLLVYSPGTVNRKKNREILHTCDVVVLPEVEKILSDEKLSIGGVKNQIYHLLNSWYAENKTTSED